MKNKILTKLHLTICLIFFSSLSSYAQVQWIVTDKNTNETVPFTILSFQESGIQAIADENGLIKLGKLHISENDVLILNAIGVIAQRIPYQQAKNQDTLWVDREIIVLDEVQVVAKKINKIIQIGNKEDELLEPLDYLDAKQQTSSFKQTHDAGHIKFLNGFAASTKEVTIIGLAVHLKYGSTELLELSMRLQNPENIPFHVRIMQLKKSKILNNRMLNNKIIHIDRFEDIYFENKTYTFSDWQTIRLDSVRVKSTSKDVLILLVPTKEFENNKYGEFYLTPYFMRHKEDGKGVTRILLEKEIVAPCMDFEFHPSFELKYVKN